MSHEYPIVRKVAAAWARRAAGGAMIADYVCRSSDPGCELNLYATVLERGGRRRLLARLVKLEAELLMGTSVLMPGAWIAVFDDDASREIEGARGEVVLEILAELDVPVFRISTSALREFGLLTRDEVFDGTPWFADVTLIASERRGDWDTTRFIDFRGKRVVFGMNGRTFANVIPGSISRRDDVIAWLTPTEVVEAARAGLPHFRRGNWHFVRRDKTLPKPIRAVMKPDFHLPEPDGPSAHKLHRGAVVDGRIYVCGTHRHAAYNMCQLDGLWEAIPNRHTQRA